ncbi:hypothetical protein ACYOEI_00070 [Singulisphaera rosea]
MSEELLKSMQEEKAKLYAETQRRKRASKELAKEVESLKADLEKVNAEHAKAIRELHDLKSAPPDEAKVELEALKSKLRTQAHRSAFDEIAKSLKVKPEALNDLFKLSDYHAEGEEPDRAKIKELIEAQVKERPYVVAEDETLAPVALHPGPGYSRGSTESVGSLRATEEQLGDYLWMRDNHAKVREASKNGTLKILQ